MSSLGSPSPFFLAGKKAYEVERSLRFNKADNAVLTRSPSSTTNSTKQTLSFWFKISSLIDANNQGVMFGGGSDGSWAYVQFYLNTFYFGNSAGPYWLGNLRLRDFSAWYHAVIVIDTTLSTSNDRQKLYINGVQQERNTGSSDPSQNSNYEFFTNSSWTYRIGKRAANDMNFDGYLAEINFVQGLALDASYFGETDATTGQWNPKKYTGSYGTNGFYLNFSDNSGTSATTLGKDSSGNGNNFTPSNFSVSAGVGNDSLEDTPTNNFCTLNPLAMTATGNVTPSNGNLDASYGSGSGGIAGTFAVSTGKWYWEITITATSSARIDIGVIDDTFETYNGSARYNPGIDSKSYAYTSLGTKYNNNTDTSYGATYTTNDVISIALDLDNGTITFYKNNVSQGQAFSGLTGGFLPGVGDGNSSGTHSISANFGQRAFAYTPPTGYEKLNSSNLPDPTILLPNKQFDTLLYSGNGSQNRAITGLNFKPDWVWLKSRTNTYFHQLHDVVRGTSGGVLYSNNTNAEDSTYGLGSFDSNGFTVYKDGNNDAQNDSGQTYVAWNWNAGDTDSKTYTVTVVDSGGNKYRFDGFAANAVTLRLAKGGTYIFNYPSAHPFRFSATSDGTHGGGSEYTTGVTVISSTSVQIVVDASAPVLYYYCTQHSGMGGQIDTNTDLGSSNFDGTTQSLVKVNQTAGFSIVLYTGNGNTSASTTIGHGLGVSPDVIITKKQDSAGTDFGWSTWHHKLLHSSYGQDVGIWLDKNNGQNADMWDGYSNFSSTVFTPADLNYNNVNNSTYINYVFSEVAGYSKFGKYTGNGQASSGPFVFTGFRPAWIIIKGFVAIDWVIDDATRSPFNESNATLFSNLSDAEYTGGAYGIDILSNGFKPYNSYTQYNQNGTDYIYLAFAESPFKNARAR